MINVRKPGSGRRGVSTAGQFPKAPKLAENLKAIQAFSVAVRGKLKEPAASKLASYEDYARRLQAACDELQAAQPGSRAWREALHRAADQVELVDEKFKDIEDGDPNATLMLADAFDPCREAIKEASRLLKRLGGKAR